MHNWVYFSICTLQQIPFFFFQNTYLRSSCVQEIERTGKLLKNVHIQLDNTTRENKNKYVATFCAWLIEMNLAEQIRLSFLPVG